MSEFAFRMSSRDRKLAAGEMVSPADVDYDPEGDEYPDPLATPEAAIQAYLQEYNSKKREQALTEEDEHLHSCMIDFITTTTDPELGPEDLPGTRVILDLLGTDNGRNGISTSSFNKIAFLPLLMGAAAAAAPWLARGAAMHLGGEMLGALNPFDGGGDEQPAAPIQTTVTETPGYIGTTASLNREAMPFDHISDNLMFESAAGGPNRKDNDIETLRAQVNSALTQWSKSGDVGDRAAWWVYYSYAHEAETIAELQTILTAIPAEFHNSVLTTPVGVDETAPENGETGLPEMTAPESTISPSNTGMSPVPIDGVGTPPKMPANQQLIPGAMASHDNLKIKPIFASTDESVFEDYAEEDRQVLARVASFMNQGTHEEDIIETLHPSYGHEYTIWAIEEAKKVASGNPLVDPAVFELGIEWKTSAENDPHDLPEGYHQLNIDEVLEDVEEENKKKELNNRKFPLKGERQGPNADEKINQQADSNMITPANEKVADYTSMPANTLGMTPAPYSNAYNQTMGLANSFGGDPIGSQEAYAAGSQANQMGLPPDPNTLSQIKDKAAEEARLREKYPDVPLEMAQKWEQNQSQHPTADGHNPAQSPAGQKANESINQLPAATTAKAAAWKDVNGNLLKVNNLYKMTSSDYEVPDYVRIVNNGSKLDVYIPRGDIDVSIDEKELKKSNYQFEPITTEKESFFLSESGLTTSEQRELIDEKGIARNLDRLNLQGTHYTTLAPLSKNDIIEVEDLPLNDFFVEDLDLFI